MKSTNRFVSIKKLRDDLAEWLPQGTTEEVLPTKVGEYDKLLIIKDASNGKVVFEYFLEPDQPVADETSVSLEGIRDEELRGVIAKGIELDEQVAAYKAAENQPQ